MKSSKYFFLVKSRDEIGKKCAFKLFKVHSSEISSKSILNSKALTKVNSFFAAVEMATFSAWGWWASDANLKFDKFFYWQSFAFLRIISASFKIIWWKLCHCTRYSSGRRFTFNFIISNIISKDLFCVLNLLLNYLFARSHSQNTTKHFPLFVKTSLDV